MQLYSPWALILLLILPVMAYLLLRRKGTAAVRFPSLVDMKSCLVSWRIRFRPVMIIARLVCVALLIVALARPRKGTVLSEISTEGVAIEAVVDHSGSMQTEMDYYGEKLNRLEVVKKVLSDFIEGDKKDLKGRSSDLIGLISFARYADTKCPLVHSHNVLLEFLKKTEIVKIRSEDGTAIGDAIALGAARLQKAEEEIRHRRQQLISSGENISDADESGFKIKSKVMILLTDGINNAGQYNPLEAAELAKKWGSAHRRLSRRISRRSERSRCRQVRNSTKDCWKRSRKKRVHFTAGPTMPRRFVILSRKSTNWKKPRSSPFNTHSSRSILGHGR